MQIINILTSLITLMATVAIPPIVAGLIRDDSQTKQDSSIPYCQCTAQRILCCSDSGCQALGRCSG
ncbi:hypothetical protein ANO14919_119240 [Xylariales sp. No.14919]|nr:hypothetical protein ANO14919_119240 [Xylariales sp. No.14919]